MSEKSQTRGGGPPPPPPTTPQGPRADEREEAGGVIGPVFLWLTSLDSGSGGGGGGGASSTDGTRSPSEGEFIGMDFVPVAGALNRRDRAGGPREMGPLRE